MAGLITIGMIIAIIGVVFVATAAVTLIAIWTIAEAKEYKKRR